MKKILLLACLCLCLGACTNSDEARRVLEAQGYTGVQITGWRPFMKGEDDFYATGFRAVGPTGKTVTGCVSSGLVFKGATVRFD